LFVAPLVGAGLLVDVGPPAGGGGAPLLGAAAAVGAAPNRGMELLSELGGAARSLLPGGTGRSPVPGGAGPSLALGGVESAPPLGGALLGGVDPSLPAAGATPVYTGAAAWTKNGQRTTLMLLMVVSTGGPPVGPATDAGCCGPTVAVVSPLTVSTTRTPSAPPR
jgi:hypothetical protein